MVGPKSLYEAENVIDVLPDEAAMLRSLLYDWFTVPTEFVMVPSIHGSETAPTVPVP